MKHKKFKFIIAICIWLVLFVSLFNCGLGMINAASSIENIIGFFIIILTVYFSISTKCFTKLFKKREKEKED